MHLPARKGSPIDIIVAGVGGCRAGPYAVRLAIRSGTLTGTTAGLAPGYIQGNIVILPSRYAGMFAAFCRSNHQACPLLAMSLPRRRGRARHRRPDAT